MKVGVLTWLPAAILMVLIFYFSAKPAVSSEESSMFIANNLLDAYENISDIDFSADARMDRLLVIDHYIRKCAHFTEYALLAAALAFPLLYRKVKGFRLFFLSVVTSAIYASSDEIHQFFVPGRSCRITDVMIDSSGAIVGALVFMGIVRLIARRRSGKLNQEE